MFGARCSSHASATWAGVASGWDVDDGSPLLLSRAPLAVGNRRHDVWWWPIVAPERCASVRELADSLRCTEDLREAMRYAAEAVRERELPLAASA